MTRRAWIALVLMLVLITSLALTARAWHEKEHFAITAMSVRLLGDADMPAWLIEGIKQDAAADSLDPDNFKNRALPQLNAAEGPEHYMDFEPLLAIIVQGNPLPAGRFEYYRYCYDNKLDPKTIGTLPYALTEWQQRLTLALAEHRKWPEDLAIQRKCLVYAGIMAHYAGDLCMPLHTTMHYDGRVADAKASSPHSGIHAKMDGLFRSFDYDPALLLKDAKAEVYENAWSRIWVEFDHSYKLVNRVYELENRLPNRGARCDDAEVIAFGKERITAATTLIASLYKTAWVKSAELKLPDWLDRQAPALPH